MAYAIPNDCDAAEGIRVVVEDQLVKVEESIETDDDIHEAVHDIRKRFKKVRAAVRLARGALRDDYTPFNILFRDAGRELSDIRDAHAQLETLEVIEGAYQHVLDDHAFDDVRDALTSRRDRMASEMELNRVVEGMQRTVARGREMMAAWEWTEGGFEDLVPGLEKSYRRAQKRMKKSYRKDTVHQFHEWRKRVKYHRYHLKILRKNLPRIFNTARDLCHEVTDLVGEDHDLAVFRENMAKIEIDPTTFETLDGLFHERSRILRESARPLGEFLFALDASDMSSRYGRAWKLSRSGRPRVYDYGNP